MKQERRHGDASQRLAVQILVVAKTPAAGRSKTRLSPPCSAEQAADIAAAAMGDTLDAVRSAPVAGRLLSLDGPRGNLRLGGFEVLTQADGALGARLAAAFADATKRACMPTLLIGMDTPQVTAEQLTECAALLVAAGPGAAVLGRAVDGGWWALGLHCAGPAAVLATVPMSRSDTWACTRRALEDTGLTVLDLPERADIDYFADALSVAAECPPDSRTRHTVAAVAAALT